MRSRGSTERVYLTFVLSRVFLNDRLEATEAQMAKLQSNMKAEMERVTQRSSELDEMEKRLVESETRYQIDIGISLCFTASLFSLCSLPLFDIDVSLSFQSASGSEMTLDARCVRCEPPFPPP